MVPKVRYSRVPNRCGRDCHPPPFFFVYSMSLFFEYDGELFSEYLGTYLPLHLSYRTRLGLGGLCADALVFWALLNFGKVPGE
jgi:hypothetical protein